MQTPAAPAGPAAPPRRRLPPWLNLCLRVGVTVALMAYALWDVRWSELRTHLREANWGWWLAGLAAGITVQMIAGIRWAALARPLGFDRPRWFFVQKFFEGGFFSLFMPSSIGGDVIKAYRVGDTTPRRLLAGCSVLADRLTGLAALGVLAGAALVATERGLGAVGTLGVAAGLLAAALAAFWLGLQQIDRLISVLPEGHAARAFLAQLLPYQQRPLLIMKAVGWSFVVQMGGAMVVALVARTIDVRLPWMTWFAVVPLVALLMVLPVSIGGFGMRETAMQFLLGEQGIPADKAVAVGLLWGLGTIVTGLIGGVVFLLDRRSDPAAASEA